MHFSEIFIRRPVATTLLTIGVAFPGILALFRLSVAPLPQADFPTLMVQASMSGTRPDVMAASRASPVQAASGFFATVHDMTHPPALRRPQHSVPFCSLLFIPAPP